MSKGGVLEIGSHTYFMGECHLVAMHEVKIGSKCAISWNTQIMDTDFHKMYKNKDVVNLDKSIHIGNHVWIASGVTINKGSFIPDDCVIASHSLISKKDYKEKSLIAGIPGKTVREGIEWEM